MTPVYIALLGALGSLARWSLGLAVQRAAGTRFPVGTLTVNVLGSAAIGAVMAVFAARGQLDARARVVLTAGFLGGFTTYSAFAWETWSFLDEGAPGRAALYAGLTILLCLGACAGATAVVRVVLR